MSGEMHYSKDEFIADFERYWLEGPYPDSCSDKQKYWICKWMWQLLASKIKPKREIFLEIVKTVVEEGRKPAYFDHRDEPFPNSWVGATMRALEERKFF